LVIIVSTSPSTDKAKNGNMEYLFSPLLDVKNDRKDFDENEW